MIREKYRHAVFVPASPFTGWQVLWKDSITLCLDRVLCTPSVPPLPNIRQLITHSAIHNNFSNFPLGQAFALAPSLLYAVNYVAVEIMEENT
jgi:hypothetical protein